MNKYSYNIEIVRVVDGDTVLVDIDLGFKMWLNNWIVRLDGIDVPEMHAKKALEAMASANVLVIVKNFFPAKIKTILESTTKPDKFGRTLGKIMIPNQNITINDYLVAKKLARPYFGDKKAPWTDEELTNIFNFKV